MKNRTKLKKRIVIGILILVIIAAVAYVYNLLTEDTPEPPKTLEDYLYRYNATPIGPDSELLDPDRNIFSYEPYLEKDRYFRLWQGNVMVGYTMEEALDFNGAVGTISRYLWSLMNADYETHAALFADKVYFEECIPAYFTQQMIYGIEVEYLGSHEESAYFTVTYGILENDLTYRIEMEEGKTQTQWFELISVNDAYKINAIYTSPMAIVTIVEGSGT